VLIAVLVPITIIDLRERIIPNRITGPAAVAAIVLGLALDPDGQVERLVAGAAAAGFFLVAALVHPGGMGMGDVKLAGVMGLYLGRAVAPAILIALIAGTLVGLVIMARVGVAAGRKTGVPFGPFLALGGVVAAVVGHDMVDAYLDRF
jgi:leader peptidase (prepilin peptidase) / N-methyltransferase